MNIGQKRMIWAYIIKHGALNVEASYWGGLCLIDKTFGERYDESQVNCRKKIEEIGIDWAQTNEPIQSTAYVFDGTDRDSTPEKYIKGMLVLMDGTQIQCCIDTHDLRTYNSVVDFVMNRQDDIASIVESALKDLK